MRKGLHFSTEYAIKIISLKNGGTTMGMTRARYKKMETLITIALIFDLVVFIAYMVFAGSAMVTLKIISTVLCILISGAILYYLYLTRELLRKRSIWMTLAAACIILCLLVSLILNFPSPRFALPTT